MTEFEKMILSAQKCGFTLDMQDSLKRIPRGFENVNPKYFDYLRLKSYLISKTLSKSYLLDDGLLENLLDLCKINKPFVSYLNNIISYTRNEL